MASCIRYSPHCDGVSRSLEQALKQVLAGIKAEPVHHQLQPSTRKTVQHTILVAVAAIAQVRRHIYQTAKVGKVLRSDKEKTILKTRGKGPQDISKFRNSCRTCAGHPQNLSSEARGPTHTGWVWNQINFFLKLFLVYKVVSIPSCLWGEEDKHRLHIHPQITNNIFCIFFVYCHHIIFH